MIFSRDIVDQRILQSHCIRGILYHTQAKVVGFEAFLIKELSYWTRGTLGATQLKKLALDANLPWSQSQCKKSLMSFDPFSWDIDDQRILHMHKIKNIDWVLLEILIIIENYTATTNCRGVSSPILYFISPFFTVLGYHSTPKPPPPTFSRYKLLACWHTDRQFRRNLYI